MGKKEQNQHIHTDNCPVSSPEKDIFIKLYFENPALCDEIQSMYLNYRAYCDEVGDYKRSAAEFKNEMLKAGYKWHKSNKGASYYGIRIASEFFPETLDVLPLSG